MWSSSYTRPVANARDSLQRLDMEDMPFARSHQYLPETDERPLYSHPEKSPAYEAETPVEDHLPPYLTPPALLALNVLSPPVLGIIIALTTLLVLKTQSHNLVTNAKKEIMTGCLAAEKALGTLESIPNLLEEKSLEATTKAVQASVRGVGKALIMIITVLEAVITFLIDTFRSTYLCCLELVVFGGLSMVMFAVSEISDAVKSSLNAIRDLIQSEVAAFNTATQAAVKGINYVTKLVNVKLNVTEISIPALSKLENVTIGTTLEAELHKLNNSLPTLNDIRTKLNAFVDQPFHTMILKINTTTFNYTFTPTPQPANVTTLALSSTSSTANLCTGLDLTFIDNVGKDLDKVVQWGVGILVALGVIAIAVLLYLERLRYKSMVERIESFDESKEAFGKGKLYTREDLMELVQLSQNGIVSVWTYKGVDRLKRLGESNKRRSKWFMALISHPLALMPLVIGIISLLSIQAQIAAIDAISKSAGKTANSSIDAMAYSMTSRFNARLAERGSTFASGINSDIAQVQTFLDDELFGSWVNTTTVVLNETLVEFYALVGEAVNATFGSTVLSKPINNFLYCIVGSKIQSLETALTWINENAHFSISTVDPNLFAISNASSDALVRPIATAALGSSDDPSDPGVIQRLVASYKKSLETSRILPFIFIGLWVIVFLGGLATVWWTARLEAQDRRPTFQRREKFENRPFDNTRTAINGWYDRRKGGHDKEDEKHISSTPPVRKIRLLREAFPSSPVRMGFDGQSSTVAEEENEHGNGLSLQPLLRIPTSQSRQNSHFDIEDGRPRGSDYAWVSRSKGNNSVECGPRLEPPLKRIREGAMGHITLGQATSSLGEIDSLPVTVDPDHSLLSPPSSSLPNARRTIDAQISPGDIFPFQYSGFLSSNRAPYGPHIQPSYPPTGKPNALKSRTELPYKSTAPLFIGANGTLRPSLNRSNDMDNPFRTPFDDPDERYPTSRAF